MNTRRHSGLISVVLVLAMLISTLAVLSIGSGVSAAEGDTSAEIRPTLETTDELRFATQYYRSNWKGSSITSASYGKWVASDGVGNGALQWGAGYTAATLDAEGVLSFPATSNPSIQYLPWQNASHNIQIGPARITFEIYYDENMPSMYLQHYAAATGSQKLFVLTAGSNVVKHGWGSDQIGVMADGWNTIEMIFMPLDADGVICTESTDTVASNIFYARVVPEADKTTSDTFYSPAYLEANFFKNASFAVKNHYRSMGSTIFNITAAADSTKVLKIRSAQAMNLTPFIDSPVLTFGGHNDLDQQVALGATVTLPEAEGVKAWICDGTYYLPGETFTATASFYFSPVTDTLWFGNSLYNTSTLWKKATTTRTPGNYSIHASEGWTGVLWFYNAAEKGSFAYSDAEKAVTVSSIGNKKNYFDWFWTHYLNESDNSTAYSGYTDYMFSFDISYTKGDFDGMRAMTNWGNLAIASVSADGALTVGSTVTGQTLTEGWNNIKIFAVQNKNTEGTQTSYTFYVALNLDTDSFTFSPAEITALPSYTWTTTAALSSHRMYIGPMDSAATAEAPATLKARNFASAGMSLSAANSIVVENNREVYLVPTGSDYTIPTVDGIDKWIANDTATGVTTVAASGDVIPVTTDYSVVGAVEDASKFGRASISLGGAMTLNMKVNPDVLTAGELQGMMAFANGTAIMADADAALDAYGYYNIPIEGILARDMWKDMDLYLVTVIDGVYYISSTAQVYSPLTYIERMYAKSEADVQSLLAAMANYGAAAEEAYYGASYTNTRTAMNALGIEAADIPALPADTAAYVNPGATDANKTIINKYVATGATLSENVQLVLEVNEGVTLSGVRITVGDWSETYTVNEDGKIIITGLNAGTIRTLFTITFIGEDNADIESTEFSVGRFLEIRRADAGEKALVEATIIYMMQVRAYALAH